MAFSRIPRCLTSRLLADGRSLRRWLSAMVAGVVMASVLPAVPAAPEDDPPPDWAFVVPAGVDDLLPEDRISVPGSPLSFSPAEFHELMHMPDWFPEDHPEMPGVVGLGRAPHQSACSQCHLATGTGVPDTAALAGLSASYIVQQVEEFRSGRRGCAGAEKSPCREEMQKVVRAVNDNQVKEAATYYSKLSYRSRTRVVEATMVPKTRVMGYDLASIPGGGEEPIGQRILELPDDPLLLYVGDWRTPVTAYVPPGSIARGKQLVENGAGAQPCTLCHGVKLEGAGIIPPLAGRSPSYIVRQLYDIQYGFRRGPALALMLPQVALLNAGDRIAIAAYLASLPSGTASP